VKPTDLRGILHYIPRFRDRTFVIAIDGAIVADDNFANILLDVAVLRSLNINVVIVHGASAQIEELARQENVTPSNLDGAGITDSATLKLAINVSNQLTHRLLEGLASGDLRAVATNGIIAYPMGIIQGSDQQFTGKVEKVDIRLFEGLLKQGIIPVVPPLGFDRNGQTYRVNSDGIAVALATALDTAKIIFVTTYDGIVINGTIVRQILAAELEAVLKKSKSSLPNTQRSKAVHAVQACQSGVSRVHLINGMVDEGLLNEVFSNEGIGTLIHANEYAQIRQAKKKDVRNIMKLTRNSVRSSELMKRTRTEVESGLNDYYIYEIDRNVVGCVALHQYPDSGKGELAFLFVSPSHEDQGLGRKMIEFVEAKAKASGLTELLALSTQAFSYFQTKAGFSEGTPNDLPPQRREKYDQSKRKSKVLIKKLQ